jgi:hypothetical protein
MCKNKQLRSKERSLVCRKYQIINFYTLTDFEKVRLNFVFCERELYDGTAPEQKTESAKNGLDSMSKPFFIIPPSAASCTHRLTCRFGRCFCTLCRGLHRRPAPFAREVKRFIYFIRRVLATLSTV